MRNVIERYSIKILDNYFLLCIVNGLLAICNMEKIAKLDLLIMLAGTVITVKYFSRRIVLIDIFVLFFILSIAISSLFEDYDYDFWYDGCRKQLYTMQFYFVGKYLGIYNYKLFKNGIVPFLIVCFVGLYLYISSPEWYMDYKMKIWEGDNSIIKFYEMSRFSAFWRYPYWISYGCAIIYSFLLYRSFITKKMMSYDKIILSFIFFIAILAQQRAPLSIMSLTTIVYVLVDMPLKYNGRTNHFSPMMSYMLLLFLVIILVLNFMSNDAFIRLLEKLELLNDNSRFLRDRADIFSDFYHKKITFWGDGIGRYSHAAFFKGKMAITDQQYMKILYETGYWGCIGYAIIIGYSIIKGVQSIKEHFFELNIILFFVIAMTGANCLSNFDQHVAIFWLCCGKITSLNFDKNNRI